MKKLMIAAVASMAAVGAFAVESANIVGYNNVPLRDGGKSMVGPCFVSVGGQKVKLSELKVAGYENNEYYLTEEYAFVATFQIRKSNGMPDAEYQWYDTTDDGEKWNGGVWSNFVTGEEITPENDVELNPGDALWFDSPEFQGSTGFYLTSAGAVLRGDQAFPLKDGAKCAVCNMLPAPTTLSKIEIQGYEDNEYYLTEEYAFVLTMQSLKSNGMPDAEYQWYDTTDDGENWNGGVWSNFVTGDEITPSNDVTIGAGEGFWVDPPERQGSTAFYFVVPKVLPANN